MASAVRQLAHPAFSGSACLYRLFERSERTGVLESVFELTFCCFLTTTVFTACLERKFKLSQLDNCLSESAETWRSDDPNIDLFDFQFLAS